jgi:hypothetical protein
MILRSGGRLLPIPPMLAAALLILALPQVPLTAQDDGLGSIDDLFADPEAGIIEQEQDAIDPNALALDEAPRLSLSADIGGGLLLGIGDWGNPFNDPGLWEFTPFGSYGASLALDYRPRPDLSFHAGIATAFPDTAVVLDELYFDYTLLERIEFRAGKHGMTWGQGQILNPGNFVSGASDAFSVKAFAPLGNNGVTAVAMAPLDTLFDGLDNARFAAQYAGSLGPVSLGTAAVWNNAEGLRNSAYLKTPIAGIDSAAELVLDWGDVSSGPADPQVTALAAFFYEAGDPKWRIIAEYQFDSTVPDFLGHEIAAGLLISGWLPGGWKPGLLWQHRVSDSTGQFLLGFDGRLAPALDMSVGIPVRYGDGAPLNYPGLEGFAEIPGTPVAALVVQLSLHIDYQE